MSPKILAFAGSLRKESCNKKMVRIAMQGAQQAGASVTYIDLKDYPLPIYDQDIEDTEGLPKNALKLKELMLSHDGFLIAVPEYNGSFPACFKNMIDWVSRPANSSETYLCCFIDKVVSIMSASPGGMGGIRGLVHVRSLFGNIYSIVLPKQKCISDAYGAFNSDGSLKNAKDQDEVIAQGAQLAEFLKKLKR